MTPSRYLKRVRRALRSLPAQEREEILRELETSLTDFQGSDADIEGRFGRPEDLAAKYVQNQDISTPLWSRILSSVGRYGLVSIGSITVVFCIGVGIAYSYLIQDLYNYASIEAARIYWGQSDHNLRLPLQGDGTASDALTLDVFQAEIIVHGLPEGEINDHESELVCNGQPSKIENLKEAIALGSGPLPISRAKCSLFLAKRPVVINFLQADLVLSAPSSDVMLTGEQATIELAIEDGSYHINMAGASKYSTHDLPISNPAAEFKIDIQSEEVTVKRYVH